MMPPVLTGQDRRKGRVVLRRVYYVPGTLGPGLCGLPRMTTHSMFTNRGGSLQRYFYYVCPRKMRDLNDACTNRSHRA